MLTLRPYQRESINSTYSHWFDGGGDGLIVIPTGGGKSLIIAQFLQELLHDYPLMRVCVITHSKELIEQNHAELVGIWPEAPAGIFSASVGRRDTTNPIIFCGIQSVYDKVEKLGKFDLTLIDECFTGGTQILTSSGYVRIDQVSCGDIVLNQSGYGIVEAISCKPAFETYRIETDDGQITECTGNHPFFTERGWVKASEMVVGEGLFSVEGMRLLWEGIPSLDKDEGRESFERDVGASVEKAKMLLHSVCEEIQPYFSERSSPQEDQQPSEGNSPFSYQAWRKRAVAAFASIGSSARLGRWMGGGVCDQNERGSQERNVPKLLQGGHSEPGNDDSHRVGRREPFFIGKAGTGSEKSDFFGGSRVVGISRIKRESPVPVFNLHVSGHPSYFANGFSVHNCHMISRKSSSMYGKFFADLRKVYPDMRLLGLTATPHRLDSGRLDSGEDAMFEKIIYEADVADLIEQGYLSPLVSKATEAEINTKGVHRRGGEFIAGELERAAMADDLVKRAATEIVARGANRRAWLCFCSGVDHAIAVRDALRDLGITAEEIDGNTPKKERERLIANFRAGAIKALTSVNVLSIGFNVPHVDLIALLRPTESPGLYIQQVGRGFRRAPGKRDCLILDFAGNVMRHGPVDMVETKDKKKAAEPGKAPVKECPACQAYVHISKMECPYCGHMWERDLEPKHDDRPMNVDILSNSKARKMLTPAMIATGWDVVRYVTPSIHMKVGKPPTLKLTYTLGNNRRKVSQWLCFSHLKGTFPRTSAERFWVRAGGGRNIPENSQQALDRFDELKKPAIIRVGEENGFTVVQAVEYEKAGVPA